MIPQKFGPAPPPRKGLRPLTGKECVQWAILLKSSPHPYRKGPTRGAKASGIRYEKSAHKFLKRELGSGYLTGPWIRYSVNGEERTCQPDGIFRSSDGKSAIIYEMKISHTTDAWWQLRKLYAPVVAALWPELTDIRVCEVCRTYDAFLAFPEEVNIAEHPRNLDAEKFNVFSFNPRFHVGL